MEKTFSRFIIRRSAYAVLTFIISLIMIFLIPRLVAVNPVEIIAASNQLPKSVTETLIAQFGLNRPMDVQFLYYIKNTLLTFPPNLGYSYEFYPSTTWSLIAKALPRTILLVVPSVIIASILGTFLGLHAGWNRGSRSDKGIVYGSITIQSVPYFWIAILFQIALAVSIRAFPTGGLLSITDTSPPFSAHYIGDLLYHAALPIITLVVSIAPVYAIVMRNNVIEVIREDYIRVAETKGLKRSRIINTYALRNAILPVITIIAVNLGYVIGSSLLVEIIFNYPGIGTLLYDATLGHDYPLIQGIFYILAIIVIVGNYIADIAYSFIDPRIRYT